jgi:hypothetical protein
MMIDDNLVGPIRSGYDHYFVLLSLLLVNPTIANTLKHHLNLYYTIKSRRVSSSIIIFCRFFSARTMAESSRQSLLLCSVRSAVRDEIGSNNDSESENVRFFPSFDSMS